MKNYSKKISFRVRPILHAFIFISITSDSLFDDQLYD